MTKEYYSTVEVADVAGISFRQLDHWIRNGSITPLIQAGGSGTRRVFTARQAYAIKSIADFIGVLREMGAFSSEFQVLGMEMIREMFTDLVKYGDWQSSSGVPGAEVSFYAKLSEPIE